MPKNVIQHIEWTTRDTKRLQDFYGRIFDWKFRQAMPDYTMIDGVGGLFTAPDQQMPTGITCYVNVKDLAATEAKIVAAGGQIYKSKQEVPGMGWFTIFGDPDGNTIAAWQPNLKAMAANQRAAAARTAARTATKKKKAGKAKAKKKK
ncbi:MAG: VOC family protein [Deltaproteobacteria bacterium]|nr:VOC family protein [Deltaproteobacteria bacterium]